jgi:hypothetical protein
VLPAGRVLAAGETLLPEGDAVLATDSAVDEVRIPPSFNGDQIPVLPATADQVADDDSQIVPGQANDQLPVSHPHSRLGRSRDRHKEIGGSGQDPEKWQIKGQ